MDQAGQALWAATNVYIRQAETSSSATASATSSPDAATRPPVYKAVGLILAIASGVFIGISFVLKKVGLLKANEKYNEEAGEGYGYLKNFYWWGGMTLMIIGEICNFVAYAFVDAILVTPMGALSVVITAILSAIFLKERLSLVGKVGCFLCIIGSVVIVLNAPSESSAANIQEMQHFVIAPGFLSYAGVIIISCVFIALWAGPRYGKKSMLVYLSICSLIGGLSVVATQGLGAAIIAQIGGTPQFNQWFLYVLFVFVVATLITEIIYLNKALNLFNAALVTPTYYVFFTSSTIITSAILFRGFKGTVSSILTVVMGFLVICSGVVLLQLSKSAKDVPDTAVFAGDLDQVRTIAEQEQPETEPKADAIRGSGLGTIVRRFSVTRQKMELDEAKRLHDEKQAELQSIGEGAASEFEWDGIRRRRTTLAKHSQLSLRPNSVFRPFSSGEAEPSSRAQTPKHPPLGMSYFPSYDDLQADEEHNTGGGLGVNFFGSIRDRARSMVHPSQTRDFAQNQEGNHHTELTPPVPLHEMSAAADSRDRSPYSLGGREHVYGLPEGLKQLHTAYEGGRTNYDRGRAGSSKEPHIHFDEHSARPNSKGLAPEPPAHSAKRQFSFHNVFRKAAHHDEEPFPKREAVPRKGIGSRGNGMDGAKVGTEEERLGLVKGDTNASPPRAGDLSDGTESSLDDWKFNSKRRSEPISIMSRARGRGMSATEDGDFDSQQTNAEKQMEIRESDEEIYEHQRRGWEAQNRSGSRTPQRRPDETRGGGGGKGSGAFI